jgi:hypothetical protein
MRRFARCVEPFMQNCTNQNRPRKRQEGTLSLVLRGGLSVDQKEFNELHARCVGAFGAYAAEAEITATMLANCTAAPMPLPARLKIALQEKIEITAHSLYLAEKFLLHEAARLGYAFTGQN